MVRSAMLGSIVIALAGCASRESPVSLNAYQSVPTVQPAAPETFTAANYRISPYDELRIDVFNEPEISVTDLPVNPNGQIVLPLAGELMAEGRTPAELAQEISVALRGYIREPAVAVNVTAFNSQKVTVEGAVRLPGVFPAYDRLTLMSAIALGEGLSDYSKKDEILVFRRQEGQRYVARFDVGLIQQGLATDPTILPGDIVVVGQSGSRRFFADSLAVLPAAVGIFIALIQ